MTEKLDIAGLRVVLSSLRHYTVPGSGRCRGPFCMPPINTTPWIFTAIVASIAAMLSGIQAGFALLSWAAAVLFALALVASAVDINAAWWRDGEQLAVPDVRVEAAIRNARLLSLGYLWGALALLAIYRLTTLRWQHGLQYGAAMALMAWLIQVYVHLITSRGSRLRSQRALSLAVWITLAHGAAALVGVVFLVGSGKILSAKGDWAANQVFLAGGLAVIALCVIASFTQWKLARFSDGLAREGLSRS